MKLSRRGWAIALTALLLALTGALLVLHRPIVYATPETKSAFLQHYSPRTVEEQFLSRAQYISSSDSDGGEAGEKSAIHERGFNDYFVIKREDWMPLMESLAKNLADQLRASGAEIRDTAGDARRGFRLQYTLGNTVGYATVTPLDVIDPTHPPRHLTPDQIPVRCRVNIHEEWFRVKPGLITVRVSSEIR